MKTIEQLQAEFEAIIYNNVKPLPTVQWEKPLNWFRLDYLREISLNAFNSVKEYLTQPELFNKFIELTKPYQGKKALENFYYYNCRNFVRIENKFWEYIKNIWIDGVPSPDIRKGQPKSKLIVIDLDAKYGQKWHLENYVLPNASFWNPQDLIDHGFRKIDAEQIGGPKGLQVYLKGGLAVNMERHYSAARSSLGLAVGWYELNYIYSPIKWIKDVEVNETDLIQLNQEYNQRVKEDEEQRKAHPASGVNLKLLGCDTEDLHVYWGDWDEFWGG